MDEPKRTWFVVPAFLALGLVLTACGLKKAPVTRVEDPERTRIATQEEHGVEISFDVPQILGIAGEATWNDVRTPVATTLASFRPLTDSRMLDVEPQQIKIVRPGSTMNLTELARRFDATVPVKTLGVINGVDPGARLEVGRAYKVVRGGKLP